MLKWKRVFEGYDTDCGRFQIRQCWSKRHRGDGFKWNVIDIHENTSNLCKTVQDAKLQAYQWSRRMSRQQMETARA